LQAQTEWTLDIALIGYRLTNTLSRLNAPYRILYATLGGLFDNRPIPLR